MPPVPRALSVALGLWGSVVFAQSETPETSETRPGIFAETLERGRGRALLGPQMPEGSASLVSERMRHIMAEQIVARGAGFDAPNAQSFAETVRWSPDLVTMERYVVNAPAPRKIALAPTKSPFLEALRTGTLYYKVGPKFTTQVNVRALPITQSASGRPMEFTRFEVFFRLWW
jgi:hypothetical protein